MSQPSDTTKVSPYYIASLPYTRFSAGVKALHLLCHNLNQRGQSAFILPVGDEGVFEHQDFCSPNLLTPLLSQQTAQQHFDNAATPIIVYPEIILGNPFKASCVVRYVLNFPGVMGGDEIFNENELCFGYSHLLACSTNYPDNILFIPTSDTKIFHPPLTERKRSGTCFYASKYQKKFHGELFEITKNSTEITSGLENSQSPEEIAEIFRASEIFYTYENTALAIEATLCGCPAVFLPNPHLQSIIASQELGTEGFAWGDAPEEIHRAKQSVKKAFVNYTDTIARFFKDLDVFISKTQLHAKDKDYTAENFHKLSQALEKLSEWEWKNQHYAPILRKLPWRIERELGAFLCTVGLEKDGRFLWNRAHKRSGKKN